MLRRPRNDVLGDLHHIITRRIEKGRIFRDDSALNNVFERLRRWGKEGSRVRARSLLNYSSSNSGNLIKKVSTLSYGLKINDFFRLRLRRATFICLLTISYSCARRG